jgi:UDP-2-acetamido-2-deoxy-ribo-hexuluronate aminotransferase
MHLQPAYLEYGAGEGSLPVAEQLSHAVLSLPMHPYLSDEEVDQVSAALISAITPNA